MTLTAISLDRYFIISKPMMVKSICTNSKVKLIVIFIWLLSLFIMSPLLFVFKFQTIVLPNTSNSNLVVYNMCFEKWPMFEAKLYYGIFLLIVLFLLPVIFMSYAYFIVGKELWFVKTSLGFDQVLLDASLNQQHHHHHLHHLHLPHRQHASIPAILPHNSRLQSSNAIPQSKTMRTITINREPIQKDVKFS